MSELPGRSGRLCPIHFALRCAISDLTKGTIQWSPALLTNQSDSRPYAGQLSDWPGQRTTTFKRRSASEGTFINQRISKVLGLKNTEVEMRPVNVTGGRRLSYAL